MRAAWRPGRLLVTQTQESLPFRSAAETKNGALIHSITLGIESPSVWTALSFHDKQLFSFLMTLSYSIRHSIEMSNNTSSKK